MAENFNPCELESINTKKTTKYLPHLHSLRNQYKQLVLEKNDTKILSIKYDILFSIL